MDATVGHNDNRITNSESTDRRALQGAKSIDIWLPTEIDLRGCELIEVGKYFLHIRHGENELLIPKSAVISILIHR